MQLALTWEERMVLVGIHTVGPLCPLGPGLPATPCDWNRNISLLISGAWWFKPLFLTLINLGVEESWTTSNCIRSVLWWFLACRLSQWFFRFPRAYHRSLLASCEVTVENLWMLVWWNKMLQGGSIFPSSLLQPCWSSFRSSASLCCILQCVHEGHMWLSDERT